jgi:hypothetical protein
MNKPSAKAETLMPVSRCGKSENSTEPREVVTPTRGRLRNSTGSWKLMAK